MLFAALLRKVVRTGTIVLTGPDGRAETIAASPSPRVAIRVTSRLAALKLLLFPNYFIGECYTRGELVIEQGDLRALLAILLQSIGDATQPTLVDKLRAALSPLFDYLRQIGNIRRATGHVQSHYDRSESLFESFLDPARQYSCAYFESMTGVADAPVEALADAQIAKMRHIAAKLRLPHQADTAAPCRVLDIGSGWGGLAEFLCAAYPGVQVTGITLSENQCRFSREKNLPRAEFHLRDYRDERGQYDRIVSVGMLEHVGRAHYQEYFSQIARLLSDDGVVLVHTIGRRGPPAPINVWIRRRIFPGAYLPSLSQLTAAIEQSGLWALDCENLRLHYAETLRCWHQRLGEMRAEFDHEFYRQWEFYLVACEMGFRHQGLTVYQLLLGKRPDAAPLTREFIYEEERRLKAAGETGRSRAA